MKKYLPDYLFLFSIAIPIILLDQFTKLIVRSNLAFGEIWPQGHWISQYARIIHISNTGAAFGILQNFGLVFTILPFIVAGVILYYFPKIPRDDWALRIALSLQFGGALGNLIDRLTIGEVTDFISVGGFAVFNIADASISIGVAILAITMFSRERKQSQIDEQDTSGEGQASKDEMSSSVSKELESE